jgi:hypothetical protein
MGVGIRERRRTRGDDDQGDDGDDGNVRPFQRELQLLRIMPAVHLRPLANASMLAARRRTARLFLCVPVTENVMRPPIVTVRPDGRSFDRAHAQRRVLNEHREDKNEL